MTLSCIYNCLYFSVHASMVFHKNKYLISNKISYLTKRVSVCFSFIWEFHSKCQPNIQICRTKWKIEQNSCHLKWKEVTCFALRKINTLLIYVSNKNTSTWLQIQWLNSDKKWMFLKHKVGTDSIVEAELRDGPITSEFIAGFDWSTHYEHTRHGIYK